MYLSFQIRFFKIAPHWKELELGILIFFKALKNFSSLFIFSFVFLTFFAYIGIFVYFPHTPFNSYFSAIWTTFKILVGQFIVPLWTCVESEKEESSSCIYFFIPVVLVGKLIWTFCFFSVVYTTQGMLKSSDMFSTGHSICVLGRQFCSVWKQKCVSCTTFVANWCENLPNRVLSKNFEDNGSNSRQIELQVSSEWVAASISDGDTDEQRSIREKCALYVETYTVKVISFILIAALCVALV